MKRLFYGFLAVFLMFLPLAGLFAQQNVSAPQKFALVIGNGSYTGSGMSKLANPVNDANDVAAALQSLGFTVDKVLDANLDQMESSIMRLKNRLSVSNETYGFFFYAGHGVQSGGENYLIPVGANIPSENSLRDRAVSVQWALAELNDAKNALNVVVLDACRDNPFNWKRSGSRGLSVVANQPADSIIVFATSAGSTAADGTGRNGLFTTHLLNNLKTPGIEVKEILNSTGSDVARASNKQQIPAIYSQFFDTAYFGSRPTPNAQVQPASAPAVQHTPQPAPAPVVQPAPTPQQTTTQQPAARPETPSPGSMVRINGGTFTMGSPANEPDRENDEVQHQVTVSGFYIGKYEVTVKEFRDFVNATGYISTVEQQGGLKDIYSGKPTGLNWKNFLKSQRDDHPVLAVSWYDAIEYCNWRSRLEGFTPVYSINKTSKDPNNKSTYDNLKWLVTWNQKENGYRLPTEAEWEYACRAATTTPYYTGVSITTDQANYDGTSRTYGRKGNGIKRDTTTAVGSFTSNAWGIHDMAGNAFEYCWDWRGNYNAGNQVNPIGPSSGSSRTARGGSYLVWENTIRSANRASITPDIPGTGATGFRIVRNAQ
jgi:formylglycine-generating enzyme required for sulfatase activity